MICSTQYLGGLPLRRLQRQGALRRKGLVQRAPGHEPQGGVKMYEVDTISKSDFLSLSAQAEKIWEEDLLPKGAAHNTVLYGPYCFTLPSGRVFYASIRNGGASQAPLVVPIDWHGQAWGGSYGYYTVAGGGAEWFSASSPRRRHIYVVDGE